MGVLVGAYWPSCVEYRYRNPDIRDDVGTEAFLPICGRNSASCFKNKGSFRKRFWSSQAASAVMMKPGDGEEARERTEVVAS